jgi:hypothetical protein
MPANNNQPRATRNLMEVLREQERARADGRRPLHEGEDLSSVNALLRQIRTQAANAKPAGPKK